MGVYTMEASVSFHDVNTENQLTMKGALRLMQEASNCHSDQVGYGLNQIPQTGYSWVLYQQRCHMYHRPGWGTKMTIRTWSRGAEGLICLRDFEMLDEQGRRVAIATTTWLLVDAGTQKMIKVPASMMEEYGPVEMSVFEGTMKRLKMLPEAPRTWEYTILKRDIDINRHVNNLCYLEYAVESLPVGVEAEDFNDVTIMYKKAAHLGDRIACFGDWETDEKGAYVTAVKDLEGQHLHAVVRLDRK